MTTPVSNDTRPVGECPHHSYNWALPAEQIDPYPSLARARQEAPVFWSEEMQCYVLTRYADVTEAARNTEAFSSRGVLFSGEVPAELRDRLPDGYPYEPPGLVNCEGAQHSKVRKIVLSSVLSPRRVASMEPLVRELIDSLLAKLPQTGTFDLIETIAVPLPLTMVAHVLGLPESHTPKLKELSDAFSSMVGDTLDPEPRLRAARELAEMREYLLDQIAYRRAEPDTDLISTLISAGIDEDDKPLSDTDLISVCTHLVEAGHETLTLLLGNLMYLLLSHPEQWRAVCEDESMRAPAVEEALRRMTSVTGMMRIVTRDVVVGGVQLKAGRRAVLMYSAANHDPEMFAEPERFDIERPDSKRHVAFGMGEHLCLGAPLARLQARCLLDALSSRFGDRLRLTDDVQWIPFPTLHGFTKFTLELVAED